MADDEIKGLSRGLTNYGDKDFSVYLRNSFASSMGYSREVLKKPIVGIANSFSGFNNCHRHFPELVEAVKRGVLLGGGLPLEFPTISLGEVFISPTSLKFRNLMSMDTEEMVRAQPMDAVVLMGGCDKTVPAQLMGAASADLPAVQLVAGPMMTSRYGEERLGACTDCRRFWGKYRAGEVNADQINDIEGRLATTAGTCAVMGTASTMACIAETLGMSLPGTAAIPAVHADRLRAAEASGLAAARMIDKPIRPSQIITEKSVENALRMLLALGGSKGSLERMNELSDTTPVLVNLKPVGEHYMEDFFFAGGVGGVLRELKPLLHLDTPTVADETLGDRLERNPGYVDHRVIAKAETPLEPQGGLVGLFGNLAPRGAVLKRSAADETLFEKTGRAVVFNSLEDLAARVDDPELDIVADDIMVLQNAGPKSASGMPEAGYLPIPKKLSAQGVKDMIRISDARMSGTAFGTIVLHVAPEASVGGPLALVRNGDQIKLSVKNKSIELLVSDEELAHRKSEWKSENVPPEQRRGYDKLYASEVSQADEGCDFGFLQPIETQTNFKTEAKR
jgi:dihydroxy-acid dehydratase